MGKEEHYEKYVKGKSAEEILATSAGAITGPIGKFVRVGAAVRTNQELIAVLERASTDSGRLAKGVAWLTVACARLNFPDNSHRLASSRVVVEALGSTSGSSPRKAAPSPRGSLKGEVLAPA
jgi:hypothetical protein